MAGKRLPMRKILEILRLRWVLGLSVRATSQALHVSTGVVSSTTERVKKAGLTYESAAELTHDDLEARLYPGPMPRREFIEPDLAWVHRELRRTGVTLELLHQEYAAEHGKRVSLAGRARDNSVSRYRSLLRSMPTAMARWFAMATRSAIEPFSLLVRMFR